MPNTIQLGDFSWERMQNAVEKVKDRLDRAINALESLKVPYAVIGEQAVAAWVSRVDEAAVRNTQDVDLLLRREDFPSARTAFEASGFLYRHVRHVDMFLDGAEAKARDAVHIVFAKEHVREDYELPAPDVAEIDASSQMRVVTLEALVRMKLTSFRTKDQMHLRDLIDVELIDDSWPARLPPALGHRLQQLLDTPDG